MALNINRNGLRTQYLTMILVPAPAVQYKQSKATESREILECHDIACDLKSYSCICQQLAISAMITLKAYDIIITYKMFQATTTTTP